MRIGYVIKALSLIYRYISFLILIPCIVSLCYKEYTSIHPFVISSLTALLLSIALKGKPEDDLNNIKKTEAFLIVISVWVGVALITAIPYLFFGLSPVNALFEATSGITATGATILTDFSIYPKAMFFWRSFSQWLGGMGIIVLFIAILPQFAIAGRQMFFAEASNTSEDKITPRIRQTASGLWKIYIALTLFEIAFLVHFNMPVFDAICNSFSTLSGGGFSPDPNSFTMYDIPVFVWIITAFMFLAGINFTLQYTFLAKRKWAIFFKDEEFKAYVITIIAFTLMLTFALNGKNFSEFWNTMREALFQVISIITTTGFASVDYAQWGLRAKILLFILMFTGASVGSASGGLKLIRLLLVLKYLKRQIQQIFHPNGVYLIKLNKKIVPDLVVTQMISFTFFYYLIFIITAIAVIMIEKNAIVGITGAIAMLGNVGPAFGAIGPMGSYDWLSVPTKIIFIFDMIVGRLELIPFLAMLHPEFWKLKK